MDKLTTPAWMSMLPKLDKTYALRVSKEIGIGASHAIGIMALFKKKGWVSLEKEGRKNKVNLTVRGRQIAEMCKKIVEEAEYARKDRHDSEQIYQSEDNLHD